MLTHCLLSLLFCLWVCWLFFPGSWLVLSCFSSRSGLHDTDTFAGPFSPMFTIASALLLSFCIANQLFRFLSLSDSSKLFKFYNFCFSTLSNQYRFGKFMFYHSRLWPTVSYIYSTDHHHIHFLLRLHKKIWFTGWHKLILIISLILLRKRIGDAITVFWKILCIFITLFLHFLKFLFDIQIKQFIHFPIFNNISNMIACNAPDFIL